MADDIYVVERRENASIPFKRTYDEFKLALNGNGYFAGSFPDGITSIAGKPISATVRVLLRSTVNGDGDGSIVAKTVSAPDGTWRIDGLRTDLKYDVVARYDGENDVIMSNVTPAIE